MQVRAATPDDVGRLLQLARGNPGAREFYRRQGYSERAGYELMDKTLVSARP